MLREQPGNSRAKSLNAIAQGQLGRLPDAIRLLNEVVAKNDKDLETLNYLSLYLRKAGRLEESLQIGRQMIEAAPSRADGHSSVGLTLLALQKHEKAAASFQQAIRIIPDFALFHLSAGLCYRRAGQFVQAETAFRKAISLDEGNRPAYVQLAGLLAETNRGQQAAPFFRRAYELDPNSFAGNLNLAAALLEESDAEGALEPLKRAIELAPPGVAEPYDLMAAALQQLGRLSESEAFVRKAIEMNPEATRPYFGLTMCVRFKEEDRPLIEHMKKLAVRDAEPPAFRANLRYGLGKSYEHLKEYANAMAEFEEANRILYQLNEGSFQPSYQRSLFDRIIETFDDRYFKKHCPLGSTSTLPVFVVGMIRSGTTLTEQILSSHSLIGGGGETRFWQGYEQTLFAAENRAPSSAHLGEVASSYLRLLEGLAPGKPAVTDKQPLNFTYLGLVHAVFPKAKVIHCRRHPVDTCLSIFVTPYRNGLSWGHSKARIVSVYREYLRLMAHWKRVLPPETMIEIDYEDLVNDREATTRKMLDFLDLEWEEACLHPEENQRSISTPSVWQARQPVYTSSVQRWRLYEPWLGEFNELLTEEELDSIGNGSRKAQPG